MRLGKGPESRLAEAEGQMGLERFSALRLHFQAFLGHLEAVVEAAVEARAGDTVAKQDSSLVVVELVAAAAAAAAVVDGKRFAVVELVEVVDGRRVHHRCNYHQKGRNN